jgi:hypothetical protein
MHPYMVIRQPESPQWQAPELGHWLVAQQTPLPAIATVAGVQVPLGLLAD